MKTFTLELQEATVTNVNERAENNGPDEKKLAMDLNVEVVVAAAMLNVLGIDEDADWEGFLFDAEGDARDLALTELKFDAEFEDHVLVFSSSTVDTDKQAQRYTTNKICKFKAKPDHSGCVRLKFQVQLTPFEDKDIALLSKSITRTCYMGIEEPRQKDFVEDQNAA